MPFKNTSAVDKKIGTSGFINDTTTKPIFGQSCFIRNDEHKIIGSQTQDLELFLGHCNSKTRQTLLEAPSQLFQKQDFKSLKQSISKFDLSRIDEPNFTYSLVQAIREGKCPTSEAGTLILHYVFLKKVQSSFPKTPLCEIIEKDQSGALILKHEYLSAFRATGHHFDLIRSSGPLLIKVHGKKALRVPTFSGWNKDNPLGRVFPILGGPYGFGVALDALRRNVRLVTLPLYVSAAVKKKLGIRNMIYAHGFLAGYFGVAEHDFAHALFEPQLDKQYHVRLELCEFLMSLHRQISVKSKTLSTFKKPVYTFFIKLLSETLDTGLPLWYQTLQESTHRDLQRSLIDTAAKWLKSQLVETKPNTNSNSETPHQHIVNAIHYKQKLSEFKKETLIEKDNIENIQLKQPLTKRGLSITR